MLSVPESDHRKPVVWLHGRVKTPKGDPMTMTSKKRKALTAAGWRVGDAADFLGLTAEERQLVELRLTLALAIRRQRQASGLSQKQLGERIGTTQPRVAKIEVGAPDVSLDQLVRAYTAAGGRIECQPPRSPATTKSSRLRVAL
jgi:predicted XRE-type DNA-binding protein